MNNTRKTFKYRNCSLLIAHFSLLILFSSCSKIGYGVLLWSVEEPPIPSGTVLPVFIKSNIEQVWVVGIPDSKDKMELPLTQLEFYGSKRKAVKRAQAFTEFASTYAESLQDGLPIREAADNNARRSYRLRLGEIIKVLERVNGNPPIGASGDPLPGDWLVVLTNDGTKGYCFSYRLKLFEQEEGAVIAAPSDSSGSPEIDSDLQLVLSKTWTPDIYQQMVNTKRYNLAELEKKYRFDPGTDTGVAKIIHPALERNFRYDGITKDGDRSWFFNGANLQMNLRSENSLAVHYMEYSGVGRTVMFTSLNVEIDELIEQEKKRRDDQYAVLFNQGPFFTSNNYGTIALNEQGDFIWTGYQLLVPQFIPAESSGSGTVTMDVFVSPSFMDRYTGALNFTFNDITPARSLVFLYILDNQGLRLEVVPEFAIEDDVVTRRSSNPMTLYFFKDS